MEGGRKGRLKVVKSIRAKIIRPMTEHNFIRWLMLKHGYSLDGAKRLIFELEFAEILKVRERGGSRGGNRKRWVERGRGYEVTKNSKRSKVSQSPMEIEGGDTKK